MRKTSPRDGAVRERIEELRQLIEAGAYRPDPSRIAEAMVLHARRTLAARQLDGFGHA
jgi:anti-sigma28 factor (negative regulator of flagellin synthesis)